MFRITLASITNHETRARSAMKIGYARVSAEDQTLGLHLDALRASRCDAVHEDRLSGPAANRPGLPSASPSAVGAASKQASE
jgi:hypothetical protein